MKAQTKIFTWNINGLRSVYRKNFLTFLAEEKPDVLCMQEVKIMPGQVPEEITNLKDYKLYLSSAKRPGYSGVGTLVRNSFNVESFSEGLGELEFDQEGRTQIFRFDTFWLLNCYFPNGQRDHARVPFKLRYCYKLAELVQKLKAKGPKEVLVCGDYNTAHHEIDLKNPSTNQNTTGFLPKERAFLDEFVEQHKMVDLFRHFYPEKKDEYTWWTYRSGCRERNVGWRIDYFFSTQKFLKQVKTCVNRQDVLGSDHCPVELRILNEK